METTAPTSTPLTPRQRVARVLAAAVTEALDGGDVRGARAAAKALLVFVESLPDGGTRHADAAPLVDLAGRRASLDEG